jgi:hypothetical protein
LFQLAEAAEEVVLKDTQESNQVTMVAPAEDALTAVLVEIL